MSTPAFSLLHATYGRPEKAIAAMRMALERAANPESIQYIFACNEDDPAHTVFRDKLADVLLASKNPANWPTYVWGKYAGSAPAWDAAAKASRGEILIQMQDDLELPQDWDSLLTIAFHYGTKPPDKFGCPVWWNAKGSPAVIAVSDGYRKDGLLCTAIMSRKYYEMKGEFLHPGYISVFSDDEFTVRALADARDGKIKFIDARHIVFRHEHPYHTKAVPLDPVYERENSPEAYRIGAALFASRNPKAATDGLRTWG